MKWTFLGTCAADFSPKLQAECKDCFDKDARRSSAVLLGEHTLIDCGPHTLNSLDILGKPLSDIDRIFFTHLHGDHCNCNNIATIAKAKTTPLHIYAREGATFPEMENVIFHAMKQFDPVVLEDMTITGMPANHAETAFPQFLYIEVEGKKILYATDGAWFIHATFIAMKKKLLDMLVLDATVGDYEGDLRLGEHNSLPMIRLMLPSMKTVKMIDDHTEIYLTHLAPSLYKPLNHDDIVALVAKDNLKVAYDGLSFNI